MFARERRDGWHSWGNERAKVYRKMYGYPEDWGTAVNVQAMVFGNLNDKSATGVLFTRNPSTGAQTMMGEWLPNAQGEDVVAGIRTPKPFHELVDWSAKTSGQLKAYAAGLEQHYKDMQDIEFTVQDGELFILQTRSGKRSAEAAFKIAEDMVDESMITMADAKKRLKASDFLSLRKTKFATGFKQKPDGVGLGASGSLVKGKAVFSAEAAIASKEPCILITHETTPDDIAGMAAAVGILTQTGGATSHAAVVARGMNKTCVVGLTDLELQGETATLGKKEIEPGDIVVMNGETGEVWLKVDAPLVKGKYTTFSTKLITADFKDVLAVEYSIDAAGEVSIDYLPPGEEVGVDAMELLNRFPENAGAHVAAMIEALKGAGRKVQVYGHSALLRYTTADAALLESFALPAPFLAMGSEVCVLRDKPVKTIAEAAYAVF